MLAAHQEARHKYFEYRNLATLPSRLLIMPIDRDTTTVIFDAYTPIAMKRDGDLRRMPRHHFVDGIVDQIICQVMNSVDSITADIHAKTFPHMLTVRELLKILRFVLFRSFAHASFPTRNLMLVIF